MKGLRGIKETGKSNKRDDVNLRAIEFLIKDNWDIMLTVNEGEVNLHIIKNGEYVVEKEEDWDRYSKQCTVREFTGKTVHKASTKAYNYLYSSGLMG